MTSHNTVGAILQAGIQSYMLSTKAQSDIASAASDVVNYRQPSYGTFGTALSVSYFFGQPNKVSFGGVGMDVDRLATNAESKINCWNTWQEYNRQTGYINSYLENSIPESIFSTETEKAEGISAVKALTIASQQGQKIYTLTSSNASLLAEVDVDIDARQEIQLALASGQEVTIHEKPINEFAWHGSGYLVIDPDTGSGSYKISGGANGSFLLFLGQLISSSLMFVGMNWTALAPLIGVNAPVVALFFSYFIIALAIISVVIIALSDDPWASMKVFGIGLGMGAGAYSLANEGLFKGNDKKGPYKGNIKGFLIRALLIIIGSLIAKA